jgi:O-antigen/teichoic acid export membrane protein
MLKRMLGETVVGYYSLASSVSVSWAFVLSAVIDSMYPEIVQSFPRDRAHYERRNRQLYAIIFYASMLVSTLICVLAGPLVPLVYGEEYLPAVQPLRVTVWYTAFSYLGVARNAWVVCENQQKYLKFLYLGSAVLNVVLNLLLIPYRGAVGAAAASLITQISAMTLFPLLIRSFRPNVKLMAEAVLLRGVLPGRKSRG